MTVFKRTALLAGSAGFSALQRATVAVAGLGAVGSFAVEALARSAIGHLRLYDFDVIHPTNINRQLYALPGTVGRNKAELAAERVRAIHPGCDLIAHTLFITDATVARLFEPCPDVLIDAIDSVNPKTALLEMAWRRGVPVISALGAATRRDPAALRLADLSETAGCPLARFIRKRLRRRGIERGIACVYSIEPANPRAVSRETDLSPGEVRAEPGQGRPRRTLGSFCAIPGMFGLACAQWAINHILDGAAEDD